MDELLSLDQGPWVDWDTDRVQEPQPLGEVLEELFARYERQFPECRFSVVETPAAA